MKLKKALARRIKTLREASGLSQQEVATKGDLSLSLVSKLEQGKKGDPRASSLLALAVALGVTPGQLLDDLFPPSADKAEAGEKPEGEKAEKRKKKARPEKEKKRKKAS